MIQNNTLAGAKLILNLKGGKRLILRENSENQNSGPSRNTLHPTLQCLALDVHFLL